MHAVSFWERRTIHQMITMFFVRNKLISDKLYFHELFLYNVVNHLNFR